MKRFFLFFLLFFIFIPFCLNAFYPSPIVAKHGLVVTEKKIASEIGAEILQTGGNAIDAAVAVGYVLAVINPCCGNIGGGGMITLHLANGKNIFINFRERAPLAATSTLFLDKAGQVIPNKSIQGYLAVAVPGTVSGFDRVLKKYGTMTREQVMAPAIQLAEKGYVLTPNDVKLINAEMAFFKKEPNIAAIFLKNQQPYQAGDRLFQTNLANTLKEIAEKGATAFYKGKIAAKIVKASTENGGILSLKDFSHYSSEELAPIRCQYRGYTIISSPPPSSGGTTLCEMLNILENYPLRTLGFQTPSSVHYIVEAMRYSFYDRNNKLGDPDFVNNPVNHLISKDYAKEIVQKINNHIMPSSQNQTKQSREDLHTTHYSVTDQFGNAVAVTYTLNSYFGAKVIAGDTGFFLNNEMDDFTVKQGERNQFGLIQGEINKIEPKKRPLSSMTPTIVMKGNKVVMVLGSPGGSRIISSTLLTILNVIDFQMTIKEAVDAKRFHQQWLPDWIEIEENTFSKSTQDQLEKMGYHLKKVPSWGAVEAIYVDHEKNQLLGANDNRREDGEAVGY